MSNFDEIKFQYAIYYKFIGLRVRGKLDPIGIFKEYWYGRRVDKLYYPSQPRTGEQQGQRAIFYDAVKNWQGFDEPTKQYYNQLNLPARIPGYNRYLKIYLEANYPMIVYWDPLKKKAGDPVTIPPYIQSDYFGGIGRVRSVTAYPANPLYGAFRYRSDFKKLIGFEEDSGWREIGSGDFEGVSCGKFFTFKDGGTIVLDAAGEIEITHSYHRVDTFEAAATDNLVNVNGGTVAGTWLILRSYTSARDTTAKDGTGNLRLAGDFIFAKSTDFLLLIRVGSYWYELSRSHN